MTRLSPTVALAWAVLVTGPLAAADLTTIDRKIGKEPAYQGKPRYALLAFGPDAATRAWIVLDGTTLYVDRNANGDLTDEGEKVSPKKGDGEDFNVAFEAGDVRDGKLTHKSLTVYVLKLDRIAEADANVKSYLASNPEARGYGVSIEVEMAGWNGAGVGGRVQQVASFNDAAGFLAFADRPQVAPVLHFGGPWQITLFGKQKLTVGRPTDLMLGVGTPGVGPGSTTYLAYEGVIPEKVYPRVEVTYPPAREGDKPVQELYELKERC